MPARTRRILQSDRTREKIQATKLIKILQCGVFNESYEGKGIPELTSEKVSAIKILLAKSLPDLSHVEHVGSLTLTHEQQLERLK